MTLSRGELLFDPEIIGTGTTGGTLTFLDGGEDNNVVLKAPDALNANYTLTFPVDAPTNGFYLQTNGSGQLTWSTVTAAAAGANTNIQFNSGGILGASANFTYDSTNSVVSIIGPSNSTVGEVRFLEASTNGTNYFAIKAALAQANSTTYTMPDAVGAAGQVLKIAASPTPTTTAATLFWDAPVSGSQTATGNDGDIQMCNGSNGFKNDIAFNYNVTTDVLTVGSGGYSIGGTSVLTGTTLGSGVVNSSLTSVGTLTQLQVDNININGNIISSTDANGSISLAPNGTGSVIIGVAATASRSRLVLNDNTTNTNIVTVQGPGTLTASYTLGIPDASPEAFSVMNYENASGQTTFVTSRKNVTVTFDGGGNVLQAGTKAYLFIKGNHKVERWTLMADLTTYIDVDVDIAPWSSWPTVTQFSPTTAGAEVRLNNVRKAQAFNSATGTGTNANNASWVTRGGPNEPGYIDDLDVLEFTIQQVPGQLITATFLVLHLELLPRSTAE